MQKMHGITIIPEIDMPGHSDAFVQAMGHDMQTAEGMKELKVILKEVAQTFPNAPFIHIGADEKAHSLSSFYKRNSNLYSSIRSKMRYLDAYSRGV